MARTDDLSLTLARRQKRLKYWIEQFQGPALSAEELGELEELFSTYKLLISKMACPIDVEQQQECTLRLETIERDLTTRFEDRRLLTSDTGSAAIAE